MLPTDCFTNLYRLKILQEKLNLSEKNDLFTFCVVLYIQEMVLIFLVLCKTLFYSLIIIIRYKFSFVTHDELSKGPLPTYCFPSQYRLKKPNLSENNYLFTFCVVLIFKKWFGLFLIVLCETLLYSLIIVRYKCFFLICKYCSQSKI